uniref:Uncharacterized protein n=1 Tax=Anabas testudineus TaxID=64144 RepID=A0A7N6BYG9_ANATE
MLTDESEKGKTIWSSMKLHKGLVSCLLPPTLPSILISSKSTSFLSMLATVRMAFTAISAICLAPAKSQKTTPSNWKYNNARRQLNVKTFYINCSNSNKIHTTQYRRLTL